MGRLRDWARRLKGETLALYLAARDRRTPWYARLLVAGIVAYALSPIDLIPDFIPVLGYLDDVLLIPLGIAIALRLIPAEVMAEARERACRDRRERRWKRDGRDAIRVERAIGVTRPLAREQEAALGLRVVERLHADAVACEQEAARARVPERERVEAAGYKQAGSIHYLGHCPLPNYDVVVSILEDLKEVLYPGYRRRD